MFSVATGSFPARRREETLVTPRHPARARARLALVLPALALLLTSPARADAPVRPQPVHSKASAAHGDDRPGLLLLSFLVPLALPLALVVPPATSRRPEAPAPAHQAPAPRASGARVATKAGGEPVAAQRASSQNR